MTHRFKSPEIPKFLSTSTCIPTPLVRIYIKKETHPKYAVIAPKHIGSAVTRNRCKRWLRIIIQMILDDIGPSTSIILIATHRLKNSTFQTCRNMVSLKMSKNKML